MSSLEVSAGIGGVVVAIASQLGADASKLVEATGYDPKSASDPDARIPLEMEHALWRTAATLLGDEAFGVHAAELVKPGMFDVLDYAVRTAPTLLQSLERLVRYNRLVHDAAVWALLPRGDALRVEHTFRVGGIVQERHAAEFTLCTLVTIGSQLADIPLRPRAVGFRHAKPAASEANAELSRLFGLEPQFLQPVNYIELDNAVVARENPKADASLSRLVERHAEALLAARPEPTLSTADRVRHVLAAAFGQGETTLADVARKLKLSERSLQRRLSDEGETFDALLDRVRRDLALRYLADPKIAVAEIAFLLGYSEPSPFHRAFKRWTGKTPSEMRKQAA